MLMLLAGALGRAALQPCSLFPSISHLYLLTHHSENSPTALRSRLPVSPVPPKPHTRSSLVSSLPKDFFLFSNENLLAHTCALDGEGRPSTHFSTCPAILPRVPQPWPQPPFILKCVLNWRTITLKLGSECDGLGGRWGNPNIAVHRFRFLVTQTWFCSILWYLLIHQMCGKLSFYSIFFPFNFLGVFLPSSWV